MNLTNTAYGTWSGGRFMHYGEALDDERMTGLIRLAYEEGVRTFVTADTYGTGKADEMLGSALAPFDRDTYCLVGSVGHDIYDGVRAGSKGYPRFTDPELRGPDGYAEYLKTAATRQAERCGTSHFDLLMLHNPDSIGYTSDAVWEGLGALKKEGLAERIGIAPGPANGFTTDLIHCFETYGSEIDWAMVILNPMEPWPGSLVLPSAVEAGIEIMTRVVDYGGLFHGDVLPGHHFKDGDHRTYRPDGWVDHAYEKIGPMKEIAERHGLSLLQFACQWNLAQPAVNCVVPTIIQEQGETARPVEDKIRELGAVTADIVLTDDEIMQVAHLGSNVGCMKLKGASSRHPEDMEVTADQWPMRPELLSIADRFQLDPSW